MTIPTNEDYSPEGWYSIIGFFTIIILLVYVIVPTLERVF